MIEDKLCRNPNKPAQIMLQLYKDGALYRELTLGFIDSKDSKTIDMWKQITTADGGDSHKHYKFNGFAFNKLFIDSCPAGGIEFVRLKLDDKSTGMRTIYFVPVEEIVKKGEERQYEGFEKQIFFKDAYLLEYFSREHPIKQKV